MGGWADWQLKEYKIRLTQPSLAGTGAELGNSLKVLSLKSGNANHFNHYSTLRNLVVAKLKKPKSN